jgi:hypothetical protein
MAPARLQYSAIASLDGYVVDAQGRFDWAAPDEDLHAFVNDHERSIGTTLADVWTPKTRLVRELDVAAVQRLKDEASRRPISVSAGPP